MPNFRVDDENDPKRMLRDGESFRIPMMARDSASVGDDTKQRPSGLILVDGFGRPVVAADSGFEYGQAVARRKILSDAYTDMIRDSESAWKTDAAETERKPTTSLSLDARPVLDAAAAQKAKNDAYAAMCQETRDAWREQN